MQATAPTGWRLTTAPMSPPGASGVACTGCGGERDAEVLRRVTGVALEALDRDRHLHPRADGRGGTGLAR